MIVSAITENEARKLTELAQDKIVLELGSEFGRSTLALASSASKVVSIDWHRGDDMTQSKNSLFEYFNNIKNHSNIVSVTARFEDALPLFSSFIFDGVFIDGFHTKEAVERDLKSSLPTLKKDGWIAFHDYGRFEVAPVVDNFAKQVNCKIHITDYLGIIYLNEREN